MALALRRPYPDELLVSVLAEYVDYEEIEHKSAFLRNALGYNATSLFDMPGGTANLALHTAQYWNLSAEAIAYGLTLYPYHVASCSPEVAATVLDVMKSPCLETRNRRGLGFGRFVRLDAFRYCAQCVQDDGLARRGPYLHRAHQLPGCAVCHFHGAYLFSSEISSLRPLARQSEFRAFFTGERLPDFTQGDAVLAKRLLAVAVRSEDVLSRASPSSFYRHQCQYKKKLLSAGYILKSGNVRIDELSSDIVGYFGSDYLAWGGLFRRGQRARDWLVPLLCEGQAVPPTIAHVLLQVFLASNVRHNGAARTNLAIQCPSRYGGHSSGRFAGSFNLNAIGTKGKAICECGTKFSFEVLGVAVSVGRISHYGKAYRVAAEEMRARGLGCREIATAMGVSIMTVRRLTSEPDCGQVTACMQDVEGWRAEWSSLFETNASLQLSEARRRARKTYRMLLKYDRQWLEAFCNERRRSNVEWVDWPVRDRMYLPLLEDAADYLAEVEPPRWVSKISILMVSGVPQGTRNVLQKLSLCQQLLRERVESRQMFRRRMLRWENGGEKGALQPRRKGEVVSGPHA
ncbi:TnsD family Tn7-like transposition protein [Paraburkholderia hospita]|uniref:TnsD family Tn7-like transposition protein n=1 Tax=Paraburkholderia hospita TaxID=169430 RepID=UPI0009A6A0EF|nr:TnsD family Tn7-like transposition protein [Paraburkholderia hospita]SKC69877.1 TniQ protein [Paraburkholderia hospita]